jgi:hypothetical protein
MSSLGEYFGLHFGDLGFYLQLYPRSDVSNCQNLNKLPVSLDGLVEALEFLRLYRLLELEVDACQSIPQLDLLVETN